MKYLWWVIFFLWQLKLLVFLVFTQCSYKCEFISYRSCLVFIMALVWEFMFHQLWKILSQIVCLQSFLQSGFWWLLPWWYRLTCSSVLDSSYDLVVKSGAWITLNLLSGPAYFNRRYRDLPSVPVFLWYQQPLMIDQVFHPIGVCLGGQSSLLFFSPSFKIEKSSWWVFWSKVKVCVFLDADKLGPPTWK